MKSIGEKKWTKSDPLLLLSLNCYLTLLFKTDFCSNFRIHLEDSFLQKRRSIYVVKNIYEPIKSL